MYDIIFYQDAKGSQPVRDYLDSLEKRAGKDTRIKYNKILEYMRLLKAYGGQLHEPYVKHLDGEIWELRPLRDRILFAAIVDGNFLLQK
jgi:phage-related protein